MKSSQPKMRPFAPSSKMPPRGVELLRSVAAGRPRGAADPRRGAIKPAGDGAQPSDARLTAHLQLLEGFLSRSELQETVDFALGWLDRVHHVSQSLCLIHRLNESSLSVVGSRGLSARA